MSHYLTFFDFKRKFGLGHVDIMKIAGCTLDESQAWSESNAPPDVLKQINAIDVVIDRIKTDNGIFTDVDAQHAAHIIEGLNKEIKSLNAKIEAMQTCMGAVRNFNGDEPAALEGDTIRLDDQGIPRAIGNNVCEIIAIEAE